MAKNEYEQRVDEFERLSVAEGRADMKKDVLKVLDNLYAECDADASCDLCIELKKRVEAL
jgi:hypothetical protein